MATSLVSGSQWAFEDPDMASTYLVIKGIQSAPELRESGEEVDVTAIDDTVRKTRTGLDSPSEFELEMQDFSKTGDVNADQEKLIALAQATTEDVNFEVTMTNGRKAAFTADVKNFGLMGGGATDIAKIKITVKRTSSITWTAPAGA